ncbi:MAG: DNA methyltransferase [Methanospirillum sp.]
MYKDVVHEDPIPIRGTTKFIDYSFRIGGIRKYIVETKRPSSRIKDDREAALQLRRYAWSAKLPLNILTNFEEWAIYDCTKKPEQGDAAGTARIEYFTYDTLLEKWDDLVGIFAKERILQGSFDQFVTSAKGKRGTISVDKDFLDTIDEWRELLAHNLALRNRALSVEDLNIAVQRIIDRIIFLRIGEDRGIEKYETLRNLLEGDGVYPRLCDLFRRADDRYNSGLFHFSVEPGWDEVPDRLTPGLTVDDRVLKTIIKQLYYPVTPYEFSAIPPAILGHVYEQFLGKVIRLTDGHKAKVEYKPEVKKAGGVFYTPDYIVDYIVRETVGRLVEAKAPEEVAAIRVLDPACGSGSFLLGAYQFLLNWHLDWYIANLVPKLAGRSETDPVVLALLPKVEAAARRGKTELRPIDFPIYRAGKRKDEKGKEAGSDWRLTTAERKRILLNNIHGVDIDQQAVEVTKLSLLLKVLEEETITGQTTLGTERALPSLHKNIRCGNSLIGSDVLAAGPLSPEEIARINPFDWEREFPSIVAAGGFDAVIGNPPYVRQELISAQKEYLKEHYQVYSGTADLYTYFFERALSLLNDHGQFSFIVANKWMRANYGKPLRQFLKTKRIEEIVDFGDLPVFENATTYPCIIRIAGGAPAEIFSATNVESLQFEDLRAYVKENRIEIWPDSLGEEGWTLIDSDQQRIIEKIISMGKPLTQFVNGRIYRGILTGLNKAFIIDQQTRDRLIADDPHSENVIKPFIVGREVKQYISPTSGKYVLYIPWHFPLNLDASITGASKRAESEFRRQYPAIYNHLSQFRSELSERNTAETGIRYEWYALQRYGSNYFEEFEKPKIISPAIVKRASYSYDLEGLFSNDKTTIILGDDIRYTIGILNSKVSDFFLHSIASTKQGGYFEYKPMYISQIPIRSIDPANADDVAKHDRMVGLVERTLDLHRRLPSAATDHEKRLLEMQADQTDWEIDALVYDLYGLSPDEIAVVEANVGRGEV